MNASKRITLSIHPYFATGYMAVFLFFNRVNWKLEENKKKKWSSL